MMSVIKNISIQSSALVIMMFSTLTFGVEIVHQVEEHCKKLGSDTCATMRGGRIQEVCIAWHKKNNSNKWRADTIKLGAIQPRGIFRRSTMQATYWRCNIRNNETLAEKNPLSTGTGFFVSKLGHVLTNYHVVDKFTKIMVKTRDRATFEAELLRADPANDIALLKIDTSSKSVILGRGTSSKKGQEVSTIGYPLINVQGQEQKATFGRVNSTTGIKDDIRFLQIDVAVQPGNSGGPLIDTYGIVVGIVTAKLNPLYTLETEGTIPENVNYAIKSDYVFPLFSDDVQFLGASNDTKKTKSMVQIVEELQDSVVLIISEQTN